MKLPTKKIMRHLCRIRTAKWYNREANLLVYTLEAVDKEINYHKLNNCTRSMEIFRSYFKYKILMYKLYFKY